MFSRNLWVIFAFVLFAWVSMGCSGVGQLAAGSPPPTTASRLTAASTVDNVTVLLQAGWNSVGLQSQRLTGLTSTGPITGFAFLENQGYETRPFTLEELNAGAGGRRGLWVLANGPASFSYSGTDDGPSYFVDLTAGWNLVSFTTANDLPGSSLGGPLGTVVLPTFQQVNADNTYTIIDVRAGGTLRAGRAYWVFANSAARLTVAGSTPTASPSPQVNGPTVTQLSPDSGWIGGTAGVTITGTGFNTVTKVTFGGAEVLFQILSDTQILTSAPPAALGAAGNEVAVQVHGPGGIGSSVWTYTSAIPPTTGGGGGGAPLPYPRELGQATLFPAAGGETTLTITTTAAAQAGDLVCLYYAGYGNTLSPSVSDSVTGAWGGGSPFMGSSLRSLAMFTHTVPTGLPAGQTITVSFPALGAGMLAACSAVAFNGYSGTVDAAPISNIASGTAVGMTRPSTTPNALMTGLFVTYFPFGPVAPTITVGSGTALTEVAGGAGPRGLRLVPVYLTAPTPALHTIIGGFGANSEFGYAAIMLR